LRGIRCTPTGERWVPRTVVRRTRERCSRSLLDGARGSDAEGICRRAPSTVA
jgi:hypothetical protein